jgi:nitrogenase molybdenum-iron protein NifN
VALGACLALRGIEGAIPLLHGSRECRLHIQEHLAEHFHEPFTLPHTDCAAHLRATWNERASQQLRQLVTQYQPRLIGLIRACSMEGSEAFLPAITSMLWEPEQGEWPEIVHIPLAAHSTTYAAGFHDAVRAIVETLAHGGPAQKHINLFPGPLSPADLRYLKEIVSDFCLPYIMLPDYTDSLEGGLPGTAAAIPASGTPLTGIMSMGKASASIEMGRSLYNAQTAGKLLRERDGVSCQRIGTPVGIAETDRLFKVLGKLSQRPVPRKYQLERRRATEAFGDGRAHVFGKRALVYGTEDLVVGLSAFLVEVGVQPVLCACDGSSRGLAECLKLAVPDLDGQVTISEGVDPQHLLDTARRLQPDFVLGNSRCAGLARQLNVPLVRVGFPIHDYLGGPQIVHIGYRGALQLFYSIANTLMEGEMAPIQHSG